MVDSSGDDADPLNPIAVLLGLNPAIGQAEVMSGRCGAAETPSTCNMWPGLVMLKYSIVDGPVRNET